MSNIKGPPPNEPSVLRSVQPQPSEQPFVYTVKDAHDAFEWLRRQQGNHAAIALAEWYRLATDVSRTRRRTAAIVKAARNLMSDVEMVARDSFARSRETWEVDWKIEDPDGFAAWDACRAALARLEAK